MIVKNIIIPLRVSTIDIEKTYIKNNTIYNYWAEDRAEE